MIEHQAELLAEVAHNLKNPAAVRLFHGRGGTFPGLEDICVDYYPPTLVIQAYRDRTVPLALCQAVADLLHTQGAALACLLLQQRSQSGVTWQCLSGAPPDSPFLCEAGLNYGIQLMTAQNIGFFPDMRLGRARAAELARDRKVLNLFAYTCSFSVATLAAGASACVNMDLASPALSRGRDNHRRNQLPLERAQFLAMDVLKSFGKLKRLGPFDLVIIDPPSQQQGFRAERDYAKLVRRLPEFLAPGADVIACLNAPHLGQDFLDQHFAEAFIQVDRLGRPAEYREAKPEQSLKIHHYRLISAS